MRAQEHAVGKFVESEAQRAVVLTQIHDVGAVPELSPALERVSPRNVTGMSGW